MLQCFSQGSVINDYVQAGCVRIGCSAKYYGQIPTRNG